LNPAKSYVAQVAAPSRLHFGLLSFGAGAGRQFGGLGAMIRRPGLKLTLRASDRFEVQGPLAERAAEFARRLARALGLPGDPLCRIDIQSAPPEHVGLGTGTQLGLAVASALHPLLASGPATVQQLAAIVGRGTRSAIGTHGFASGGLLFEQGKLPGEAVSPLTARVVLPQSWRFVLFWPEDGGGLSGQEEREAFSRLGSIPEDTRRRLIDMAAGEILPAAEGGNWSTFGQALYRYGHTAGTCFAQYQHGAYASERVGNLVEAIRGQGIAGVGQSSWGPTVYAVVENEQQALNLVDALEKGGNVRPGRWMISEPAGSGATIETTLL